MGVFELMLGLVYFMGCLGGISWSWVMDYRL